MQAVQAIQADSAFSLTSSNCALQIASKLSVWIPHHASEVEDFEQKVCKLFKSCITGRTKNAVMWTKYHTLRTSDKYLQVWNLFIQQSTECNPSPMFCQYIGHHIFKGIIKATYTPLNTSNVMSSSYDFTCMQKQMRFAMQLDMYPELLKNYFQGPNMQINRI